MKDMAFLLEIQKLAIEMDNLVDKYEMRDKFISILVSGFLDENEYGELKMNAIYSYHMADIVELTEILDFIDGTFEHEFNTPEEFDNFDEDVYNFLKDLGIETE